MKRNYMYMYFFHEDKDIRMYHYYSVWDIAMALCSEHNVLTKTSWEWKMTFNPWKESPPIIMFTNLEAWW